MAEHTILPQKAWQNTTAPQQKAHGRTHHPTVKGTAGYAPHKTKKTSQASPAQEVFFCIFIAFPHIADRLFPSRTFIISQQISCNTDGFTYDIMLIQTEMHVISHAAPPCMTVLPHTQIYKERKGYG